MVHLYLEHSLSNQNAFKVVGLTPVGQPWRRFLFIESGNANEREGHEEIHSYRFGPLLALRRLVWVRYVRKKHTTLFCLFSSGKDNARKI